MKDLWKTVNSYLKKRQAKSDFGQLLVTPATIKKRSIYISKYFNLERKNLLFLGDDDFLSIAIALLNKSSNIMVIDIDKDVLYKLKTFKKNEGVQLKTYYHDLLEPLPRGLCGQFDVFFCDPIWNYLYFHNFILRGMESLSKQGLKTGVLSFHISWAVFGEEDPSEIQETKRKFFENAFLAPWKKLKIIEYKSNFNKYVNGVQSDLFLLHCSDPELQYKEIYNKI